MGELLKEFLKQTINNLQILQQEASGQEIFAEEYLRRLFRQLHTLKGSSNTFNLGRLAHLTHEIEDLLQALQNDQISQTSETTALIQSSFTHLLKLSGDYLSEKEITFPQEFTERIRALLPNSKNKFQRDLLYRLVPPQLTSQLSATEKNNLNAALQSSKTFYLLEVCFDLATFYEDFKDFKEMLAKNGEVIAVSPAENENSPVKMAFQVFYVTARPKDEIEKTIVPVSPKFVFESYKSIQNKADNVAGMVANLVDEGEQVARLLDKKIIFETSLRTLEISKEDLVLLNEIISHLLHNAVDHGIETTAERINQGKDPLARIEINIAKLENALFLEIRDDGRGIEVEKVTRLARQKGLISSDRILDDAEALEITFQPGFSTSKTVSEVSGRGIGLDAVRDLVEKRDGRIEVNTRLGQGTTFSIYLPQN